jgi:murein DD-endopeptidase MepM/ murein hydrolase activator NlpD
MSAVLVAPAAAQAAEAAPGTVVRWPGAGIEACGIDAESWTPLGEACWYAIDLLAQEGAVEVWRQRAGRREQARVQVLPYPYEVQYITLEDDSRVNLSPSDLERVRRDQALVAALWGRRSERRFRLPLAPPLADLPDGGRFGARRFFNNQPRSPHTGRDYGAAAGTPVTAVAAGEVALIADLFFSGRSVFLDHGDGLISMYFHLSEVAVEEGALVERGEALGRVGQTGRATGPHLHFGLRWRGARIDPDSLLRPLDSVPAIP